jgi:RNA polymerase sigma-70 factor (ECF subfamily)
MLPASAELVADQPPARVTDSGVPVHELRCEPIDIDAATVNAARQGDRAAFARLHARYASMVHGIALARVPHADSQDLVQEAFMLALDRLHLLRDDRAFGPWLATIARNLAVEFHRRQHLRSHEPLADASAQPVAAADASRSEYALRLLHVIRSLPEAYAETLVLRLVEGLTGPQIAACTGMTHGSVRVNLTRGMQLLRTKLLERGISQEDSP